MGGKQQTQHAGETFAVFWFPETVFDEPTTRGSDGDLTPQQLCWLVDKMAETTEYDALRRAGKSVRSFHEIHIGAGVIEKIEPIEHEFGGARGIVEGLGLGDNQVLEIVHSDSHGIAGYPGKLTFGLLWKLDGDGRVAHLVCNLADLREHLDAGS